MELDLLAYKSQLRSFSVVPTSGMRFSLPRSQYLHLSGEHHNSLSIAIFPIVLGIVPRALVMFC